MVAATKKLASSPAKTKPSSVSVKDKVSNGEELVGSKVKVWWPIDRKFYNGVVDSFNSRTKKHRVFYDDGEKEILDLKKERWELVNEEDDGNADEISLQEKTGNEVVDAAPEPTNRKSARTNGIMGDIGGKMVAAASRLRSCKKIPEATANGKKKRASSEAVTEKVKKPVPSSKKGKKRSRTDDEHASDDESKPLQSLVDKLKGKKKKKQEKEAPKEEVEEGEAKEEAEDGEPKEEVKDGEPKEEVKEGEPKEVVEEVEEGEPKEVVEEGEPKEEVEEGEPKEKAEEGEQA